VLLLPASTAAQPYAERQKLTAFDAGAQDNFGSSVAVSGDVAFIGAHRKHDNQGAVYVFTRDAQTGAWSDMQTLAASDGRPGDKFGSSVAVSGDIALIGAEGDGVGGERNAGSVYVFARDDMGLWTEIQKLAASVAAGNDEFGREVAITGDVALIGAPGTGIHEWGAAYVFVRDAETGIWAEVELLIPSDGSSGQCFGCSIAFAGNWAFIGAPQDYMRGGSAWVFERDTLTGAWIETQWLHGSDSVGDDGFGRAVSISGDMAIIGASASDNRWIDDGAAFVFFWDAQLGTWVETQKLLASDAAVGAFFGSSVSLSGDVAVIGAHGNGIPGAAYVFARDTVAGTWVETQKLIPSGTALDDHFGEATSVSSDVALIGAPEYDGAGDQSGAAYVFERGAPTGTAHDDPPRTIVGTVVPNPTDGAALLPLTLAAPSVVKVSIHDALGRRVAVVHEGPLAAGPRRLALPVGGLPAGVYAVRVEVEGAVSARMMTLRQ
jgi:hypothetical protein